MNLGLKNRLRLISLFPIVILLLVTSYVVYDSYNKYVIAEKYVAMKELNIEQMDPEINQLTTAYIALQRVGEATVSEKDFVSGVLSDVEIMKEDKVNNWIALIATADAIKYDNIDNIALVKKLDSIFQNKQNLTLFKKINEERAHIFSSIMTAKYDVDVENWKKLLRKKERVLVGAENILSAVIDKKAQQVKESAYLFLVASISVWALIFILSILGYLLSNEIAKNVLNLEDLLKRIVATTEHDEDVEINLNTTDGTEQAYGLIEKIVEQAKKDKEIALDASEAKSMFLANMSHEIRTPLNGIVGFTELLKDTELEEEQSDFVEIIEKSSENLLEIINNILDLSKIESNKLEIEDVSFYPIEEFESAVEVYAVRASEKHVNLSCFIEPSLEHPLKGDPTKIKEVLINLLSNAVKFTSSSGSINVNIRKEETDNSGITRIRFEVQDSGIGVTSEQKTKIFEAFSQADTSITRKYGGTGLGLTISSNFIELMGGQLDLHSETGKGTTFFFTLDFEEIEEGTESQKNKFSNLKALILESGTSSKKQEGYLREYLDFYGVEYTSFRGKDELVSLQKSASYDLLFIDYEYSNEESLTTYSEMTQGLVLITKSNYMKVIDSIELNILKTIYEPLNNSKIQAALKEYHKEEIVPSAVVSDGALLEDASSFDANILVAEDNIINQKLIKRTLEALGLRVSIASNGLEAFQKRKDNDYDLIFMDIQMPFLDGVEATKEILEYEDEYKQPHVPIVALTANALKGDREIFLKAGLDEYTTKPLVRAEILSILNNFLNRVKEPEPEIVEELIEEEVIVEKPRIEVTPAFEYKADVLISKASPLESKLFSKLIEPLGYTIEVARSTEDLYAKLQEENYKIALFDKSCEGLNVETLYNITQEQEKKTALTTQLILMNNDADNADENDAKYVQRVINNVVSKDLLGLLLERFI